MRGNVQCCFHEDKSPSLALGLRGGGARCHAATCRKSIGNVVHFESELKQIPEKIAVRRLFKEFVRKTINTKEIVKYREELSKNGNIILRIRKELGLNAGTLKRFSIGWDAETSRVVIPVFNRYDLCINTRLYKLPSMRGGGTQVKIYNREGYGSMDLFPANEVHKLDRSKPVFWMSAETEVMLARQYGLQAFCSTTGEGSWDESWNPIFKGCTIYSVLDMDKGGTEAFGLLLEHWRKLKGVVYQVKLPFSQRRPDYKDFRDWVIKDEGDPRKLTKYAKRKLGKGLKDTDGARAHRVDPNDGPVLEYPKCPGFSSKQIHDIADLRKRPDLLNKRVRTQGIVAARSPNTYAIPWKFKVKPKGRPSYIEELEVGRWLLMFVGASDEAILRQVQNRAGGTECEVKAIAHISVTEVEIIPIASVERDVDYVVQRCFYFGPEIKDNTPYYFEIIPTTAVRSQEVVGIITHCAPISMSIDRFEMTKELQEELSTDFAPQKGMSVWKKLKSIANAVASNYTQVVNRIDWHMVALLTWASPIGWKFPQEPEYQRGWFNSLAIGDTETGKSKVSKALQTLFNCGVFVNSENCTYVGLVGGAIKMGSGQLMLRWGRIPLSDKQLVVLEELSGLSIEELSNMSDVRSSGIARLDKGGINSQTNSRTRLLCLSNVRSKSRNLSGYLSGVRAIQDLIGHGEDIARFDLITTLIDNEVDVDTINTPFATNAKLDYVVPRDSFQNLIRFIWSLRPDQIEFRVDAYEECLEQTKKLSAIYHPSIPIFKGGSGRYKLGRIAASIACLQFSYAERKDGGKIIVKREHVLAAVRMLRFIYDKPSFGYLAYSEQMYDRDVVKDETQLERFFKERTTKETLPHVLESLIHLARFNQDEFCSIGGLSMLYASQLIGYMLRCRVIRKGEANVWEITLAGKQWMERYINKLNKHERTGKQRKKTNGRTATISD